MSEAQPVVKKRKKKNTFDQRYLFDKQLFEVYLYTIVKQQAAEFSNLLRPDVEWELTDDFILAMHAEMSRLLKRLVEKSSFFGKYRILSMTDDPSQKNKKEKPQVKVKESDFNFGWKAIKTDALCE